MTNLRIPSCSNVFYKRSGSGPTLVQVHGMGLGHWNVKHVSRELSDALTCVDIDMPGYGRSAASTTGGGIVELADSIAEFIEALGEGPQFVHGTSYGGQVVIALAARHSHLVRKLVVSASLMRPDGAARQRRVLWQGVAATGDPELYAQLTMHDGLARSFFERPDADELMAEYRQAMMDGSADAKIYHDALVSTQVVDMIPLIEKVGCPTLVIGGTEDALTPLRPLADGVGGARLVEMIPDARLVEVPEAGHFVLLEQPGAVAAEMIRFLVDD